MSPSLPKLAFLHIPKTGGETLYQILVSHYDKARVLPLHHPADCVTFAALDQRQKVFFDLIHGHFRYGFDPGLPRRFRYVTILREPVARVVSVYNHLMTEHSNYDIQPLMRAESWSLLDFVSDKRAIPLVYPSLCQLVSESQSTNDLDRLVEAATTNLVSDFAFVQLLEWFDEGLIFLREAYGPRIAYRRHNVRAAADKVAVSPVVRAEVTRLLEPEIRVYEAAKVYFWEQLDRVKDLEAKVAAFRLANQRSAGAET